jgi:hypothetical protein
MAKTYDWQALCVLADPNPERTVAYRFSNGKEFFHEEDPYASMVEEEEED